MAGMEIDSLPLGTGATSSLLARDRIVQKIVRLGIPLDQVNPTPSNLVNAIKANEYSIPNLVTFILPTDEEVTEILKSCKKDTERGSSRNAKLRDIYSESLLWMQWLMFKCDPENFLHDLAQKSAGNRAVCGSIWGSNELAYRCRTCELDPTCAICVPCFQNGDHKDHDYSVIYTGGGCCDCGDESAWKIEGFCSKHKGIQQIQPLSQELTNSVGSVIDIVFSFWRDKLSSAEHWKRAKENGRKDLRIFTNEFSSNVLQMLLEFCNCSESLLSFISKRIVECSGLLDILIRAERFLGTDVVNKLHELLLKLLGEPLFKYEIAKALVPYYLVNVNETIKENSDSVFKRYTLLPSFSVQIFTVPTLTTRLVKEVDLLGTLLGCLTNLFISCLGENGLMEVNKWANMYETTVRVIEDIRYVMSHNEVPIYIAQERPDITRAWLKLLSLVQGMDPQKRETGIHIEEDNENIHTPFSLCYLLGNIQPLLAGGAFSVPESMKTCSNGKNKHIVSIGELQEESSSQGNRLRVPDFATWFIVTCLKFIEDWLIPSSESRRNNSLDASGSNNRKFLTLRKKLFRITTNRNDASTSFLSRVGLSEEALTPDDDDDPMDISETHDLITEYFNKNPMLDDNHGDINSVKGPGLFKLFSSGDWPDIEYDVSSQEISFHAPLHRLLSFLLRRALKYIYEDKLIEDNALASSRQLNFFEQVLNGSHPYGFSAYIMETPLRLRVFCAQVRAGMWRRNGDTAFIGREMYRSVQWLETGLEPDLFLLQCCAALAPSDLFVKRIQQRFGLTSYTDLDLGYHNEYESVLVQEMLTLILQIVRERRYCGLSTAGSLRREMIYRLAISDATRSQLLKSLPRDVSKCDQLRNILDTIAVFSQPSAMKQGKYSLRKEVWKELDLYHPRWSSRDLQMAEERYLRFCEVSALNAQLPKWSPLFEPLNPIANIATSKSTSQIVRAVIFYAVFSERSSSSRAPDGVLITALHLLHLALDICETQSSLNQSCCSELCPFFDYAIEEFTGAMDEIVWRNQSLLSLLIALMKKHKKGNDHDIETNHCNISSLIENLLKKFAKLNTACLEIIKRDAPDLVSDIPHYSRTNLSTTSDAKDWKAKARAHQAAVMAKMKASQSKFMASLSSEPNEEPDSAQSDLRMHMTEFDHVLDESVPICSLCRDSKSNSPLCFLIHLQKSRLTSFIDRGPISWDGAEQSGKEENQSKKESLNEQSSNSSNTSDFLSQNVDVNFAYDIKPANKNAQLFSLWHPEASYSSSLSSTTSLEMLENDVYQHVVKECATQLNSNALNEVLNAASSKSVANQQKIISLNVSESTIPVRYIKFGPINCDGIHISSCGHAVHQECHDRYILSLKQRRLRRLGFEGGHIVDPDLGELLCPVCRRFANSLLPAYPSTISNSVHSQVMPSIQSQRDNIHIPFALCLLENTAKIVGHSIYQKALFTKQNDIVNPSLEPCLRKLFTLYSSNNFDTLLVSGKLIQSLVLWDTLLYSIKSAEVAARGKTKTYLTSSLSLDDLYKELYSSDCILTLLLCVAQNTRMSCHRDALLRFRGLQFLAGSICYGVSGDKSERGTFLSSSESPDESVFDIMFFKHVADPILCHDPFTSLMWAIYCLPSLFLYSKEIFNSFVQLFHTVCVIQALVTCYSSHSVDVSCLDDYMLKDVYNMTLQSEHVRSFFVSNYINDSCHPKDMIRRFTFPYLRRCALLWKMLQSSVHPLHKSSHTCQVNPCANSSDDDNPISAELNGIKELEDMFQIQSLELVLKNSAVHTLALKWLGHFCEEFNARNHETTLFSSPAVPFKLIQLPRLYEDLLQRYIKVSCSSCNTILQDPALCLLCGTLCSAPRQSCCRASKCLIHATNCAAGIGVFLLVRRTTVFLQRSMRESSWHSPYLDAFGEEDVGMTRGRPLYLNEERYATLTYLVASHGLDRASDVLLQTTINMNGPE